MKVKAVLITLALCLAATSVVMAKTSPQMGTWKLNEAKSKFAKGAAKNHTVVYEAAGDDIKVTVDGVDGDGNATHNTGPESLTGNAIRLTAIPLETSAATRHLTATPCS